MIQIRQNIFETNSSSTHVLVIMKTKDFNKFHMSEADYDSLEDIVFWNEYGSGQLSSEQKFKTGQEFIDEMKSEGLIDANTKVKIYDLKQYANNQNYYTFDQTVGDMEYESITEGTLTAFSYIDGY